MPTRPKQTGLTKKGKPQAEPEPPADDPIEVEGHRPDFSPGLEVDNPALWSDVDEVDPFLGLFDNQEVTKVEIYRLEPQYLNGVDISGFLDNVNPGDDLQAIKAKFGGGRYKLVKRLNSGKFGQQAFLRISGSPITKPVATPSTTTGGEPVTQVEIEGVPFSIGGEDKQFFKELQRVLLLKKLLAEPATPDINTVLLQHVLTSGRNDKSPLETINEIKTAAETLGIAGAGGETNILDLVNQGLKTLQTLAVKSGPGKAPAPVRLPAAPRPNAGLITDKTPVEQPENNETHNESGEEMTTKEMAHVAVSLVVQGFRLAPPKEPTRIVALLDSQLGLNLKQRAALVAWKETLFDLAEIELSGDFEDVPEKRAEFERYYNEVFDLYVEPEREAKIL